MPWPSTASTSDGRSPADASAARITCSWAGPLGALRPFDAPSELTAEPRTTASTRWPSSRARDSRSTSSSPAPSAKPVPSAAAAYDRQRPPGASPPIRLNSVNTVGAASTVTPPAIAAVHSPARTAAQARCSATSEEEQAVSTVSAGPRSPKTYASRPEATLPALPVANQPPSRSGSAAARVPK